MVGRDAGYERLRSVGVVLGFALILGCSLVGAPFAAAGSPTTDASTPSIVTSDSVAPAEEPPSDDPPTLDHAGAGTGTDNSSLEPDDDGTTEVVVRLAELDVDSPTEDALRQHAKASQREVVDFAERTDGVAILNRFWVTNAVVLEVDTERVDPDAIGGFEAVSEVHANFEVSVDTPTSNASANATASGPTTASADSGSADATDGLELINAPDVWERFGATGSGATVAVLDTGVDPTHPDVDLADDGWAEFDSWGNQRETEPMDHGDHGTHVSATVAGGAKSGTHIGVAPDADLLHGAVLTDCTDRCSGSYAQIIAGIEWAVEQDADVASMSLSDDEYVSSFVTPVRNALEAGTVVVASAGNDGDGTSGSPGNVYDSFAVGASEAGLGVPSYSGGEEVETDEAWTAPPSDWPDSYVVPNVVAPGENVFSAAPGGGYVEKSGTSMATPHAAGAMALLLSIDDDLEPDELTTALETTAYDRAVSGEQDTRYGHGVIDVRAAAESVHQATFASYANDGGTVLFVADTVGTGETVTADVENAAVDGVALEYVEVTTAQDVDNELFSVEHAPPESTVAPHDGAMSALSFDADGVEHKVDQTTLAFTVADDSLPDHVEPADLAISVYDGDDWEAVETRYDGNTITATVDGFKPLAFGLPDSEPPFEVVETDLEATEVTAGDEVELETTIKNGGLVADSTDVVITVGGDPVHEETVQLEPGERTTITAEPTVERSASLAVNDEPVGHVTTESGATFLNPVGGVGATVSVIAAVLLWTGLLLQPARR